MQWRSRGGEFPLLGSSKTSSCTYLFTFWLFSHLSCARSLTQRQGSHQLRGESSDLERKTVRTRAMQSERVLLVQKERKKKCRDFSFSVGSPLSLFLFHFFSFPLARPLQLSLRYSPPTLALFAFRRFQRVFYCLFSTNSGLNCELRGI